MSDAKRMIVRPVIGHEGTVLSRHRSGDGLEISTGDAIREGSDVLITLRGLSRSASERIQLGQRVVIEFLEKVPEDALDPIPFPDPNAAPNVAPTTVFIPTITRAGAQPEDQQVAVDPVPQVPEGAGPTAPDTGATAEPQSAE